jgi:hypothetical protein
VLDPYYSTLKICWYIRWVEDLQYINLGSKTNLTTQRLHSSEYDILEQKISKIAQFDVEDAERK